MLKLFQSIFCGKEDGRYPEALIEAAIERTVEGADRRRLALPGYRKQLCPSIRHSFHRPRGLARRRDHRAPAPRDVLITTPQTRNLQRSGWSVEAQQGARPEPEMLSAELQAIESELESLGAGSEVLQTRLDTVVNVLGHTEQQLWGGSLGICTA